MFSRKVDDDLELILLQEQHAPPLFDLVDRNREHLREWLGWLDKTQTAQDTLDYIKLGKEKFAKNIGFELGIVVDGEIAGVLGTHFIEWQHRRSSIGYWLGAEYTGRGAMTRSVAAVLDYLFVELKLNYVEIHAAPGNAKSRAVPERLGFKQEGVLRDYEWLYDHFVDHVHYGIRVAEWANIRQALEV
ncbi:MAG: GNAT family N-acetyltransferase [Pseudomonadota bacterium]